VYTGPTALGAPATAAALLGPARLLLMLASPLAGSLVLVLPSGVLGAAAAPPLLGLPAGPPALGELLGNVPMGTCAQGTRRGPPPAGPGPGGTWGTCGRSALEPFAGVRCPTLPLRARRRACGGDLRGRPTMVPDSQY
jgi:hypothetical protein